MRVEKAIPLGVIGFTPQQRRDEIFKIIQVHLIITIDLNNDVRAFLKRVGVAGKHRPPAPLVP